MFQLFINYKVYYNKMEDDICTFERYAELLDYFYNNYIMTDEELAEILSEPKVGLYTIIDYY